MSSTPLYHTLEECPHLKIGDIVWCTEYQIEGKIAAFTEDGTKHNVCILPFSHSKRKIFSPLQDQTEYWENFNKFFSEHLGKLYIWVNHNNLVLANTLARTLRELELELKN